MFKRSQPEQVQQPAAPAALPVMSAYEDVSARSSQWWTDEGLYMGYEIAPPADENHPLRGEWVCTGKRRNYRGDRHVLTVGPNGSGKSRRLLLPNLYYLKNWSIVAIDPKGELFAASAVERAKDKSHKVVLIDPFGVVKSTYPGLVAKKAEICQSNGFNPVAALRPKLANGKDNPRFVDDAKALALALIKTEGDKDKYWSQAAQALVKGLIMGQRLEGGTEASLISMRAVLGMPPEDMAKELARLVTDYGKTCPPLTASLSEFMTYSAQDREIGGIRRQAKVQTDWLDSGEMADCVGKGEFDFASIKQTPTTIYLVLPPEFLASHGTWLRLMITSILRPLLRSVEGAAVPVLFMLDEFAQLGRMEIIEDNYALMRGYGVKLWTIFQDLNQAKILYKDRWESFISNAGMVQSFAPQDMTTRKYLSQLADERMTWHQVQTLGGSAGMSLQSASSSTSVSQTSIKEPLIYPYELGQMRQGWGVVFTQRGEVHRRYFPDATHPMFGGVADMMAEAAVNMAKSAEPDEAEALPAC